MLNEDEIGEFKVSTDLSYSGWLLEFPKPTLILVLEISFYPFELLLNFIKIY